VTDVTLRRALARIEESYLEPGRLDPERMIAGALRAAKCDPTVGRARAGSTRLAHRVAAALEPILSQASAARVIPLRAAMLSGAVGVLDRYSRAVTGPARVRLHTRFSGAFCGIGVTIGRREGRLRVLRCLPDGGADQAGMRPGDGLIAVDGLPVAGMRVADLLRLVRGRPGTIVKLTVDRQRVIELSCMRRRIVLPSVHGRTDPTGVLILRLSSISKATPQQVDRWLASAAVDRALPGLVLDLRGNKGGSMLAAAALANRFVRRGNLLEALDRADRPVPGLAHRVDASERDEFDRPIAILQDASTASAAELLAACLAWNDRAILIGAPTRGKNTILKLYPYPDADLTLRLAVAYMRTAGRRLPPGGLLPDVARPRPEPSAPPRLGRTPEDPDLSTALSWITEHGGPVSRD
jgi:carboxyl-terminal processing protease